MTTDLRPHVILLYSIGDELRPVLAIPSAVDSWRFQLLQAQPQIQLNTIKAQAVDKGAQVYETDTPIIISYRIPLWHARRAVDRVNRALVVTAARRDEEAGSRLYR